MRLGSPARDCKRGRVATASLCATVRLLTSSRIRLNGLSITGINPGGWELVLRRLMCSMISCFGLIQGGQGASNLAKHAGANTAILSIGRLRLEYWSKLIRLKVGGL